MNSPITSTDPNTTPIVRVHRGGPDLGPNVSRVLLRAFNTAVSDNPADLDLTVGKEYMMGNGDRVRKILKRILTMGEREVHQELDTVMARFGTRHRNVDGRFRDRFLELRHALPEGDPISEERQRLIGAYFLCEYSFEAAALFNPSIVPHPDQSGLPEGSLRFMLSLRATGEGHISSVTFREGTIGPDLTVQLTPPAQFASEPRRARLQMHEADILRKKARFAGVREDLLRTLLGNQEGGFELGALRSSINSRMTKGLSDTERAEVRTLWTLATSNCDVEFAPDVRASERVLFPLSPSQSNGIEDARFVQFHDDDGSSTYFATYTAYDGHSISPQMIHTDDFLRFQFITLSGTAVSNKGMALFPRKINGRYVMLSRQDNQNILVMSSDSIHFWDSTDVAVQPTYPWEFVQLGNCGSPVEIPEGWLVLTHGVGPVRRYCIGAVLLDKEHPAKLLGRLRTPLIETQHHEREGYVPNVVYTCGALVHAGALIIPFALSDRVSTFASVPVHSILNAME
jgi:predicted GH43/DUF377 family glycosyl hydrolase